MSQQLPRASTGPADGSTRLDSYVDRYAARTEGMTASEIRALFAVASPARGGLAGRRDAEHLRRCRSTWSASAIARPGRAPAAPVALQYGSGQGDPTLREQICDVMRLEGIEAHPDDVVVTVGSQQAVDLVTRIFCDPGDVVICEAPSYVGALGVFKAFQCDVVHVEMDDARAGARGAARRRSRACRRPGKRDQVPLHDPELPQPRRRDAGRGAARRRSCEICRERRHAGARGQPLRPARLRRASRCARCAPTRPTGVIYLGSFSKTFAPGLPGRLGAGPARRAREAGAGPGVRDAVPAVVQPDGRLGVPRARTTGSGQIKQFREMYRERRDAMIERARRHDARRPRRGTCPTGGFYVWVTLPAGPRRQGDAAAGGDRAGGVRARARRSSPTASARGSMRLSYCYPTPERIREGVRRLAGVIEEEMELRADVRHRSRAARATRAAPRVRRPDDRPDLT